MPGARCFCLLVLPACFSPRSGDYTLTEVASTSDCPDAEVDTGGDTGEQGAVATVDIAPGGDQMSIGDLRCALVERSFDCPLEPLELDMGGFDQSAVITVTYEAGGAWTSSRAFALETVEATTCAGEDCADVGATACTRTAQVQGALIE